MHDVIRDGPATEKCRYPGRSEIDQLIRDARLQRSLEIKRMLVALHARLRPASADSMPTRSRYERLLREVAAVDGKVVVTIGVSIMAVSLVGLILG